MINKKRRVNTELFKEVVKKGRSFSSGPLYLKLIESPGKTRLTFSVPRSAEKSVVKRNKLKRKGSALLKIALNKTKDGFTGVIFLKNANKKMDQATFKSLLEKAGLVENISQ